MLVRRRALGKVHHVVSMHGTQHVLRVSADRLVLAHEVVLHRAGAAQPVVLGPVFVQALLPHGVHEVLQELVKTDLHVLQPFVRPLLIPGAPFLGGPEPPHDATPVMLPEVEGGGHGALELVAEGRQQSLEGFADEHELEVVVQPVLDLCLVEAAEGGDQMLVAPMHVARAEVQHVLDLDLARQHQHDPTPVGARHLGHVAVQHLQGGGV